MYQSRVLLPCPSRQVLASESAGESWPCAQEQVVQVVLGHGFAVARTLHFEVFSWGENIKGLGRGPNEKKQILGLVGCPVSKISAGHSHACALCLSGSAFTWGDDPADVGTLLHRPSPVMLLDKNNERFADLACGTRHSVFLVVPTNRVVSVADGRVTSVLLTPVVRAVHAFRNSTAAILEAHGSVIFLFDEEKHSTAEDDKRVLQTILDLSQDDENSRSSCSVGKEDDRGSVFHDAFKSPSLLSASFLAPPLDCGDEDDDASIVDDDASIDDELSTTTKECCATKSASFEPALIKVPQRKRRRRRRWKGLRRLDAKALSLALDSTNSSPKSIFKTARACLRVAVQLQAALSSDCARLSDDDSGRCIATLWAAMSTFWPPAPGTSRRRRKILRKAALVVLDLVASRIDATAGKPDLFRSCSLARAVTFAVGADRTFRKRLSAPMLHFFNEVATEIRRQLRLPCGQDLPGLAKTSDIPEDDLTSLPSLDSIEDLSIASSCDEDESSQNLSNASSSDDEDCFEEEEEEGEEEDENEESLFSDSRKAASILRALRFYAEARGASRFERSDWISRHVDSLGIYREGSSSPGPLLYDFIYWRHHGSTEGIGRDKGAQQEWHLTSFAAWAFSGETRRSLFAVRERFRRRRLIDSTSTRWVIPTFSSEVESNRNFSGDMEGLDFRIVSVFRDESNDPGGHVYISSSDILRPRHRPTSLHLDSRRLQARAYAAFTWLSYLRLRTVLLAFFSRLGERLRLAVPNVWLLRSDQSDTDDEDSDGYEDDDEQDEFEFDFPDLFPGNSLLRDADGASRTRFVVRACRGESMAKDFLADLGRASEDELSRGDFRVSFRGEPGVDEGGLKKELFELVAPQLFDTKKGLFVVVGESRVDSSLYLNRRRTCSRSLREYEKVGIFCGLAFAHGIPLATARLPTVFFKKLVAWRRKENGKTSCVAFSRSHEKVPLGELLEDLEEVDGSLARGLSQLLAFEPKCLVKETFQRDFVYGDSAGKEERLCPFGEYIAVDHRNRRRFARLVASRVLHTSVAEQFDNFARGFWRTAAKHTCFDILEPEDMRDCFRGVFSEEDCEPFDWAALRAVSRYDGWQTDDDDEDSTAAVEEHPVISKFWEVVMDFDHASSRNLLMFVTGSKSPPLGGLGALKPPEHARFRIQRMSSNSDHLPTANVCFNTLLLPEYDPPAKLAPLLHRAIRECEGFGLV